MKRTLLTTIGLIFTLFSSFIIQAEELKIASWNIAWLGSHKYNQRTASDYQQLAHYAKKLNADVIALQEVESEYWARKVFGNDYDYYFSTKNWVQRVGVAIKKSRHFSVKAKEYKTLDVGKTRHGIDITLTQNNKTLHLLAVHLKSGCFVAPLDINSVKAMPTISAKEKKKKEACTKLNKQIKPLAQWINLHNAQNAAYIVLGDFNRRLSQDISLKSPKNKGLWQALNNAGKEALWTPTATVNSACWGGYYKDYIDHIIFNPKAKNVYIDASFKQLVFKTKYTRKTSLNLSDHCPISVKLVW